MKDHHSSRCSIAVCSSSTRWFRYEFYTFLGTSLQSLCTQIYYLGDFPQTFPSTQNVMLPAPFSACSMPTLYLFIYFNINITQKRESGFPGSSVIKNPSANAGDTGSVPGLGRFRGEGNDNPLPYSCLKNPMDREAWRATIQRVTKTKHTKESLF